MKMSVDEKTIERLAKLVHYYHGALAPDFGCGAARDLEWNELASNERKRSVAAVRLALLEVDSTEDGEPAHALGSWQKSSKEGREWGC
jgi:hypothetical protein